MPTLGGREVNHYEHRRVWLRRVSWWVTFCSMLLVAILAFRVRLGGGW